MTREIALDTETTGLDPKGGHRIVEIGLVEMVNRVRTGNTYHVYINPERDMPEAAQAVHGLSNDFLSDKPLFKDVAEGFMDFVKEDRLVIHNAQFDMKFINWELAALDMPEIPNDQAFCTLVFARKKFPGAPASLDALCRRFNIDNSARELHGALLDAELLADMYLELMGGSQTIMELGGKKSGAAASSSTDAQGNQKILEARAFKPSEEEEAAHAKFLEKAGLESW